MTSRVHLNFVSILFILLIAFVAPCIAQLTGKVVSVEDGDTVTVLDASKQQTRVRLSGIDCPESGQDFGTKAKQFLSKIVYGAQVVIVGSKIDRYGRRVGKIIFNGRDINLDIVTAGYAWHYKEYEREQSPEDRRLYAAAEIDARAAKKGLWSMSNAIPPWEFRRGRR